MSINDSKYPYLGFYEWPFQVVPDDEFVKIWADRKEVLKEIHHILRGLLRRRQSSIHLLWAWYGAGKSHSLMHMAYLCRQSFPGLLPVYTEYPKTTRSLRDLYTLFLNSLPENLRSDMKVKTSDDAVHALADSVRLIREAGYYRLIWMIDEFQRIGTERKNAREDVLTGLHSAFNHSPNFMSFLFSFSVGKREEIFPLLSKELIDRIGIQKILEIKLMSPQEALNFVSDLIYEFRIKDERSFPAWFPFEEETARYIIWLISERAELKPRAIMQYFNAVLERAENLIELGNMKTINVEFAKNILESSDLFFEFKKEG